MIIRKLLFYLCWPLLWWYAPLTRRVRVLIECRGEQLLVLNWFGPQQWQLPGGGIKRGESVFEAARREVFEELGITLPTETSQTHEIVYLVKQFGLTMRYQFVVVHLDTKPEIQLAREIAMFRWAASDDTRVAPEVRVARSLL